MRENLLRMREQGYLENQKMQKIFEEKQMQEDQRELRKNLRRLLKTQTRFKNPFKSIKYSKQLGFSSAHEPVTAVQLSSGKAEATLTFEIALLLGDLSRLAWDLLLFYTSEFAFVSLSHEMTTGSSIMPQKRNPDVLELIRSTQAVATGALTEILSITTKLNSGYQRDLQRVKAPLFRVIDLANDALGIMEYTLEGITFKPENIHLNSELNAAEQANRLAIEEGIPFREAYQKIASLLDKID